MDTGTLSRAASARGAAERELREASTTPGRAVADSALFRGASLMIHNLEREVLRLKRENMLLRARLGEPSEYHERLRADLGRAD